MGILRQKQALTSVLFSGLKISKAIKNLLVGGFNPSEKYESQMG
jgi:hypothetical protein